MDLLFEHLLGRHAQAGKAREFVTGNNDADGVYLLYWVQQHFPEKVAAHARNAWRNGAAMPPA